jgi:hypothetical protein
MPAVTEGKAVMAERSTLGKISPFPTLEDPLTVVLEEASMKAGLLVTDPLVAEFTVRTWALRVPKYSRADIEKMYFFILG